MDPSTTPLQTLTIAAAGYRAKVAPAAGGIVAALDWLHPDGAWHPLLRGSGGAAPGTASPNRFGCWAMLPFANRAFGSVVDDGVTRFRVPRNDEAGTIHGFGWQAAWEVLEAESDRVVLSHTRSAGPDPYRYRATQEIALAPEGLRIGLTVENRADSALPYGFGLHPWFDCASDTTLTVFAKGKLSLDGSYRATGATLLADGGPYADGPVFRRPSETALSLLGWDGRARIATPSQGFVIALSASETLRCPVVWAPPDADFLCVEPQSHAIGSPSEPAARKAAPMTRLAPGERLEGWMTIAAEAAV